MVGTIHGANVPKCAPNRNAKKTTAPSDSEDHPALATPVTQGEIIQILDDNEEDDLSVLTTKMQDKLVALLGKPGERTKSIMLVSRLPPVPAISLEAALLLRLLTPMRAVRRPAPPATPTMATLVSPSARRYAVGRAANSRDKTPPASTRRGASAMPSGQCSGQVSSRQRRNQQRCASYRESVAVDNVGWLANTCNQLRNLCTNRSFKRTEHTTIMDYLGRRAKQFRKNRRSQGEDMEKIISELKGAEEGDVT